MSLDPSIRGMLRMVSGASRDLGDLGVIGDASFVDSWLRLCPRMTTLGTAMNSLEAETVAPAVEDAIDVVEVFPDESTRLIVVRDSSISAREIFKSA